MGYAFPCALPPTMLIYCLVIRLSRHEQAWQSIELIDLATNVAVIEAVGAVFVVFNVYMDYNIRVYSCKPHPSMFRRVWLLSLSTDIAHVQFKLMLFLVCMVFTNYFRYEQFQTVPCRWYSTVHELCSVFSAVACMICVLLLAALPVAMIVIGECVCMHVYEHILYVKIK